MGEQPNADLKAQPVSIDPATGDRIDVAEFLKVLVEDTDRSLEGDLGTCGWYQRQLGVEGYEEAICSFGCRDEPECQTCEPGGGWPSQREGYDERVAWAEQFIGDLLANALVAIDLGMGRPAAKPVVALDCPSMTEAEYVADSANAIRVTCQWDTALSDELNVFGILARAQRGPDTMAVQALGFDEGGTDRWKLFGILVWDRMKWLRDG